MKSLQAKELQPGDSMTSTYYENLVLKIQNLCEYHYHHIWNSCTSTEKLILFDLAEDGLLNVKNSYMVERLISRGLLIKTSQLRIFNESFTNFILTSIQTEEAKYLENKLKERGRWNNSRIILFTILASLLVFFVIAEQHVIDRLFAMLSAVGVLIPVALRLFTSFIGSRSTSK